MIMKKKHVLRLAGVLVLVGCLVSGGLAMRPLLGGNANGAPPEEAHLDEGDGAGSITAEVIQPRLDPNFTVTVTQPADVQPYYRIDIRARVAGPVLSVRKAIGDAVKEGEELIVISVPDLVADVAKKLAVVKQRQSDLKVAQAMRRKAEADIDVAKSVIEEKQAGVRAADATTAFRKQELARFRGLSRSVTGNILAERQKFYESAVAAGMGARAAVKRAFAEELAARAKLQEAIADEELKESLIDVAQKDVDLARELLGFATLKAPFDGVVTQRNVDPGSFVQNSGNTPGPGLLTIVQTELLTIYANIPDSYAPYIDDKTEAIIRMTELPEVDIRARVTRFSPSLQTPANDRTMRVEVDLYNRGPRAWRAFLAHQRATAYKELKGGKLPVFPEVSNRLREKLGITRLMPGMYGNMTLVLRNLKKAYLIPSQAVFSKGGKPYVFIVSGDIAHLVPVEEQFNDGILAKVVLLKGRAGTKREELSGKEHIVLNNQGELSDGQSVKPSLVKWKPGQMEQK
jgi:multidrug efflux pump subunit AcrA (membrane-fusion protein)